MSRTLLAIGLVTVAMLSAGACSSSGSASAGGAPAAAGHSTSAAAAATKTTSSGGGTADINACSLLSATQASTLTGKKLTSATPSTIATGQDQCQYNEASGDGVTVIVYQPNSGVSLAMLSAAQGGASPVGGVGDKAVGGSIELDVQSGTRIIAIQDAGGTIQGGFGHAIAVAKAIIAALP